MKYGYIVKRGGVYYRAGAEVPDAAVDAGLPFLDTGEESKTYTAEELAVMTVREIRQLAADKGIQLTKTTKDDIISEFVSLQ